MNKIFTFFLVIASVTGAFARAQLPDFTISATSQPQTCLGNGAVTLTVTGNDPAASMQYAVYLLPNTTTPVTTVTTPVVTGLVAGNYQVIATQLLNGQSNTATTTVTVADNVIPLQYTLSGAYCTGSGTITVVVASGTAVSYEIISGPVTKPLQSTNVFTGLPQGQYQVRVFDNCGDGIVTTIQLSPLASAPWVTGWYDEGESDLNPAQLPSCNTIMVTNMYGNTYQMQFPVTFNYTVHPPDGSPDVTVTNMANNYNTTQTVTTELPYYGNQPYSYTLVMTDACGNQVTENFTVNRPFSALIIPSASGCGDFIDISLVNFKGPVTVSFLSAPAGFNPLQYSAQHPTFSIPQFHYGTPGNTVPNGDYTIKVTDACGNSAQASLHTGETPVAAAITDACSGSAEISVDGRTVVSVQIISAPAAYTPLPNDVSGSIVNGTLFLSGLPPGNYVIVITDSCGGVQNFGFNIPNPLQIPLFIDTAPGCGTNEGSLYIAVSDFFTALQSVIITQAPAAFNSSLPLDVSANIYSGSGTFDMMDLPEGDYHVVTQDACGSTREADVTIHGYEVYNNDIEVIENCGSFDLDINFSSNLDPWGEQFWLQRYNEVTGNWEHPATGAVGNFFNAQYAMQLYNNQVNYNLPFEGQFRVGHTFSAYGNDSVEYTQHTCSEVLKTFTYTGGPRIIDAYAFPCANGLSEVVIYAEGIPPLTYQITTKNGDPFVVNGQGNVFTALADASYTFTVTDACNNIVNRIYDITDLEGLEIIPEGFCAGEDSSLSVRYFSFLTYEWWKGNDTVTILGTTNELLLPGFNPDLQAGTYYLKIESTTPGSCIDTLLEYTIVPKMLPNSGNDVDVTLCIGQQPIDLATLLNGNDSVDGTWQDASGTGALNGSVLSPGLLTPGQYGFTYTTSGCNLTDEAVVNVEILGDNTFLVTLSADCMEGKYIVSVTNFEGMDAATIEWTGPGGFSHTGQTADISNMDPGTYVVTVTNTSGCISTSSVVADNTSCFIPRGISPGDPEYNNEFDLSNLDVRHLKIFNRYGLQVYEKNNYINEWHGQSDKGDLPTGTYFYVITLQQGKQVTGWVYLLRKL